jgi:hypothetical protein
MLQALEAYRSRELSEVPAENMFPRWLSWLIANSSGR